jgi:hypothetical protein
MAYPAKPGWGFESAAIPSCPILFVPGHILSDFGFCSRVTEL